MTNPYVKKIRNLPTLPSILAKLISTLDDPRSTAKDLEYILRNDQSMTTKLLSVANSAYYAFRHSIATVRRAAVAIGFAEVRNICMGLSLMSFLHPASFRNRKAAESLWLHSLMTAEGSKLVADLSGKQDQDVAFTAGLLHDMGKVVLAAFFAEDVERLVRLMDEKGLDFGQAEMELEMDHQSVGRALAKNWRLPPLFSEVMGRHHHPSKYHPFSEICSTVHIANYLTHDLGFGDSYNTDPHEVEPNALETLGLSQGRLTLCRQRLEDRQEKVFHLWENLLGS